MNDSKKYSSENSNNKITAKMEIKIFDTQGKMVAERHYFPQENKTQSKFLLSENQPGVYIVNIIVDDVVKTRKIRLK